MKRVLILLVFLFVVVLSVFASVEPLQNTRHLSYSSVLALDGILGGVYDLEEDDVRPYEWKDALQDLKDSFSLAYVVEGTVRKDFLKSEKHDLDLGVGLSVGVSPAIEGELYYGALLDLNFRYI
ncbi:MAG: hypothetical protein KBS81_03885 [Spirochaetales bacterium]|nr:hypothetical protein [Candidatus Physcosoma equi]